MHFERLLQHFVVNVFCCIEFNNFNWVRINQQKLRVDLYAKVMNRLSHECELNNINKKIIILLFNHVDESRYMKVKRQNVLTLIRKFEKSNFFITFTCNFNHFELIRDLFFEISIQNRSNLCNKMFQSKLKELIRDLIERHVLKEIKIYVYVIEFQKRDLFHAHILIINHFRDEITKVNVNQIVQTMIFFKFENEVFDEKRRLYELITTHMIHKNCWKIKNVVCHDKNDNCIKSFSKSICNKTNLNHFSSYSQLRRFERELVSSISWDNKWVVSYNTYLLLKYEFYINVEICTSIKLVTYLYKYVFKKSNHANVSI